MKSSDTSPHGEIRFKPRTRSDASAVRLTPENSAAAKAIAARESTSVVEVVNQILPLGIAEYQRRNGAQSPAASPKA